MYISLIFLSTIELILHRHVRADRFTSRYLVFEKLLLERDSTLSPVRRAYYITFNSLLTSKSRIFQILRD